MSSIRIQNFLALVNERLLDGNQLVQLTAFWEEAHQYAKCQTTVLTGERQGQVCNKACVKDKDTCMCHSPRPPKKEKVVEHREQCTEMTKKGQCPRYIVNGDKCKVHQPKEVVLCYFVLKTGDRKGTTCGKVCTKDNTFCSRHMKENGQVHVSEKVAEVVEEKVVEVVSEKVEEVVSEKVPEVVSEKVEEVVKEKVPEVVQKTVVEEVEEKVTEVVPEKVIVQTSTVTCDWIMKSGAKKGQLCGKKCVADKTLCVLHM